MVQMVKEDTAVLAEVRDQKKKAIKEILDFGTKAMGELNEFRKLEKSSNGEVEKHIKARKTINNDRYSVPWCAVL